MNLGLREMALVFSRAAGFSNALLDIWDEIPVPRIGVNSRKICA